jgi:hypothetical protein
MMTMLLLYNIATIIIIYANYKKIEIERQLNDVLVLFQFYRQGSEGHAPQAYKRLDL